MMRVRIFSASSLARSRAAPPVSYAPMAPMIAPISSSTMSQWPPSIQTSRLSRLAKLLLTKSVVMTKPSQQKRPGNQAAAQRKRADMAEPVRRAPMP